MTLVTTRLDGFSASSKLGLRETRNKAGLSFCKAQATMFRRVVGPLLSKAKETTGLVGLNVVPNARDVLVGLYNETLKAVQVIPESAVYRQNVERTTRFRLSICEQERDWESIETKINAGQVEELIEQAKDELQLIPKMAEWKPWEVPEDYKVEIVEVFGDTPCHVPDHRH